MSPYCNIILGDCLRRRNRSLFPCDCVSECVRRGSTFESKVRCGGSGLVPFVYVWALCGVIYYGRGC